MFSCMEIREDSKGVCNIFVCHDVCERHYRWGMVPLFPFKHNKTYMKLAHVLFRYSVYAWHLIECDRNGNCTKKDGAFSYPLTNESLGEVAGYGEQMVEYV